MCDALNVNCLGCLFRELSALQSALQYVILSTRIRAISCSICYNMYTDSFSVNLTDSSTYYLLHSVLSPFLDCLVGCYIFFILLFEYCFLFIAYVILPVILSVILLYCLLYYLLYCYIVCYTVCYTI